MVLSRTRPAPAASDVRVPLARPLILRAAVTTAVVVWALSAFEAVSRVVLHHDGGVIHLVWRLFDLDREGTLSSWFQGTLLLANGAALALIAALASRTGRPFARHWAVLAAVFLFLSADEVAAFHEDIAVNLRERLHAGGIFENIWVLPAMVLVGLLAFAYRRFFRALPRHTLRGLILAAALFLGGAVVLETIGGDIADKKGENNVAYVIEYHLEEGLEMAGSMVALATLLTYREESWPGATLVFDDTSS